jgi:hypothetical protein
MGSYSFQNVVAGIAGPNGNIQLGAGAGTAEGGISVAMRGDKNTLTVGADGTGMNSLHADNSGSVTVRLLKTSPINALLMSMYNADRSSSLNWGKNVISIRDYARGDHITCTGCAFKKAPDLTWDKEGQVIEWVWDATRIEERLGTGTPAAVIGGI